MDPVFLIIAKEKLVPSYNKAKGVLFSPKGLSSALSPGKLTVLVLTKSRSLNISVFLFTHQYSRRNNKGLSLLRPTNSQILSYNMLTVVVITCQLQEKIFRIKVISHLVCRTQICYYHDLSSVQTVFLQHSCKFPKMYLIFFSD